MQPSIEETLKGNTQIMRLSTTVVLAILFAVLSARAAAAPCTTATAACSEMVAIPGSKGGVLIYRSHPLGARNAAITRGLIVIHGLLRDADSQFRSATAAAFLANALGDTLVIAPRFASNDRRSCKDEVAPGELLWHCQPGADTWRHGGEAIEASVNSFDVVDELLRRLNDRSVFPNMRAIVLFGHSAGGQYVNRYAMANTIHEGLAVKPAYIVANPSSYAYFDELRPTRRAYVSTEVAAVPGYWEPLPSAPGPEFRPYGDRANCTTYDSWPYGMQHRVGYAAKVDPEQMKKNLAARAVTYMVGEYDIFPAYGFDASCAAMAQGPTRVARGLAYAKYVERFGAKHSLVVVDTCAHSARCVLTSEQVLPLLFPKD